MSRETRAGPDLIPARWHEPVICHFSRYGAGFAAGFFGRQNVGSCAIVSAGT